MENGDRGGPALRLFQVSHNLAVTVKVVVIAGELVVVGADQLGQLAGQRGFIVSGVLKADGDGFELPV